MTFPAASPHGGDRPPWWRSSAGVMSLAALGIVVIPWVMIAGANSYAEPEAADHVRMSFAIVIASTTAIASACLFAITSWRHDAMTSTWPIVIAIAVISIAIGAINAAAARLVALIG